MFSYNRAALQRLISRSGKLPSLPTAILVGARLSTAQSSRTFSRLRVPETSTLPQHTQETIQAYHNDNWTRALALNPDTLRRFVTHYEDLFSDRTTRLQPADREIIAVVVSATNGCGLCRSHHTIGLTAALGGNRKAKLRAKRIALDWHLVSDLSGREKALATFAERLAAKPRDVGKKALEELKAQGLTDEEVLEVVEVVGWFSHSNRLMIALGVEIDERYLE